MILLAITSAGLDDALRLVGSNASAVSVWCGADAISEPDYAALANVNVSRFNYPLQGERGDALAGAINTIEEHHPGETVWIEQCA